MTSKNKALTISELESKYQLCRQTIYKEIREGRLLVMRVRGAIRVTPNQESAWVDLCATREATTLEKARGAA